MKLNKEILKTRPVFSPEGRLDASNAGLFKSRLNEEITAEKEIVIDLSRLEFLDSSGIGALISIHRKCDKERGGLKLVCQHDRIRKVLELTRADRLFDIYDEAEAAAGSFLK